MLISCKKAFEDDLRVIVTGVFKFSFANDLLSCVALSTIKKKVKEQSVSWIPLQGFGESQEDRETTSGRLDMTFD